MQSAIARLADATTRQALSGDVVELAGFQG
jgi:hypothetical protein